MNRLRCTALLAAMLLTSSATWAGSKAVDLSAVMRHGATPGQIARLIRQGADVNHRDASGVTPLMSAAMLGRADLVPVLLKAGARSDAVAKLDDMPVTAWDFAVVYRVISHDDAILHVVPPIGTDGKALTGKQAVARIRPVIEAFGRQVVKARLNRVDGTMMYVAMALITYDVEHGGFPGTAGGVTSARSGQPVTPGSVWALLGAKNPPLAPQVAAVHYVPFAVGKGGKARSFGLIFTLQDIKAGTVDGQLVGLSPSSDMVISGPAAAQSARAQMDLKGGAFGFSYSCHQMTDKPVDPLVLAHFANAGHPITCH